MYQVVFNNVHDANKFRQWLRDNLNVHTELYKLPEEED